MARVLVRFRDQITMRLYDVGDEWDGTPERLETLARGGYVQSGPIAHDGRENGSVRRTEAAESILSEKTVAELRKIADERGIEVPKRAKRSDILSLLGA